MTKFPTPIRAGHLWACLSLVLLCPAPGRALTNTCSATPTGTETQTATSTPDAYASPLPTPTTVPASVWFSLSRNLVWPPSLPLEVRISVPMQDRVTITVFNVAGEVLFWERIAVASDLVWRWEGEVGGRGAPPGVYFVSAHGERGTSSLRRFVLLR